MALLDNKLTYHLERKVLVLKLSMEELQFFHIHIEADEGHEEHGLEICSRYSTTRLLQEQAIATVSTSARMRYRMLDGVWDATAGKNQTQAAE